jgi:hypothetical protein
MTDPGCLFLSWLLCLSVAGAAILAYAITR